MKNKPTSELIHPNLEIRFWPDNTIDIYVHTKNDAVQVVLSEQASKELIEFIIRGNNEINSK